MSDTMPAPSSSAEISQRDSIFPARRPVITARPFVRIESGFRFLLRVVEQGGMVSGVGLSHRLKPKLDGGATPNDTAAARMELDRDSSCDGASFAPSVRNAPGDVVRIAGPHAAGAAASRSLTDSADLVLRLSGFSVQRGFSSSARCRQPVRNVTTFAGGVEIRSRRRLCQSTNASRTSSA